MLRHKLFQAKYIASIIVFSNLFLVSVTLFIKAQTCYLFKTLPIPHFLKVFPSLDLLQMTDDERLRKIGFGDNARGRVIEFYRW